MIIKVIFTGGTIGSRTDGGYIGLGERPYALIDRWNEKNAGSDIVFFSCEPYSILSENITPEHFLSLAGCAEEQLDGADAVIITHGTDTLCYTAAFLGFVFADADIPIILVSSGYPLDDARANGHENFAAAVDFAKTGTGGVFAVWYADGAARVHLGTRTLPHAPYSDMLESVGGNYFGTVKNGVFIPHCCDIGERERRCIFKGKDPCGVMTGTGGFGRVVSLSCRPGMYYPELNDGISAVLFESYHSGTMCTDAGFAEFADKAASLDIPLFLCGTGGRDTDYESVKQYRKAGVIPLPEMSPSAAYIKLSLAASLGLDLKKAMSEDWGGEYII